MRSYLLLIIALVFGMFACQEDIVNVEDYRQEIYPPITPDVTIEAPERVSAFDVIFSGYTETTKFLIDAGFFISKDTSFTEYTIVPATFDGRSMEARATNLEPETQYFYKAYSVSYGGGIKYSEIRTLKTLKGVEVLVLNTMESSFDDWQDAGITSLDMDGDGEEWILEFVDEVNDLFGYYSFSYYDGEPLEPHNYLLFPGFKLDGTNATLQLSVATLDYEDFEEKFEVVVHSEQITKENHEDAEVIHTEEFENPRDLHLLIDIPEEYEGGMVYLAVVHRDVTDQFGLLIWSIEIKYALP